jgi:hypothetical protein
LVCEEVAHYIVESLEPSRQNVAAQLAYARQSEVPRRGVLGLVRPNYLKRSCYIAC